MQPRLHAGFIEVCRRQQARELECKLAQGESLHLKSDKGSIGDDDPACFIIDQ